MSPAIDQTARKILAWLVPALLSLAVAFLAKINAELRRISESVAISTVRIDWLEKRMETLETKKR